MPNTDSSEPVANVHANSSSPHTSPRRYGTTQHLRRITITLLIVGAVGGSVAAVGVLTGFLPNPIVAGDPNASGFTHRTSVVIPTVKVVHPKWDPQFEIVVEQLATVEPYYEAELRSRASGVVRAVHRGIGEHVRKDELLVELDVPELIAEVDQKAATVEQRQHEVTAARTREREARAGVDVMRATLSQRDAEITAAEAIRDFRKLRLDRFQQLLARGSLGADVIEEQNRDYLSGAAAVAAAKAAQSRAKADISESQAKLEGATADISLKEALVRVARKDLEKATVFADYAKLRAPFEGVVIRRQVDPGSFVPNVSTAGNPGEPLITLARIDLVTLSARFPDNTAQFIHPGTPAEIVLDGTAGSSIAAHVSRIAPGISGTDRTVRVEVDLFNGTNAEYTRFLNKLVSVALAPLAANDPVSTVGYLIAGKQAVTGDHKGISDFPPLARPSVPVLPGTAGMIRLQLSDFANAVVIPSSAVFNRSGMPQILLIENEKAVFRAVRVLVNDGRLARVRLVNRIKEASGATREVLEDLTGNEWVVPSRQAEYADGQTVKTAPTADW